MADYWAWVEEGPAAGLAFKPIVGYRISRTQFPPDPPHPAVNFDHYDPDTPSWPALVTGSAIFGDFDVFAGWNGTMTRSGALMSTDTSGAGAPFPTIIGQTPRLSLIDTTSTDLSEWFVYPRHFDLSAHGITFPNNARFVPGTDNIAFLGTKNGRQKLLVVDTETMTLAEEISQINLTGVAGDISAYAYSFTSLKIALTFSGQTRVYGRSGMGPGAQISGTDIFGTYNPDGIEFSQDGKYILGWDGAGHRLHNANPPFNGEVIYFLLYAAGKPAWHPASQYFVRATYVSGGFGPPTVQTLVFNFAGVQQANLGGTSENAFYGDWSHTGDVWLGSDGGRDPYGGFGRIVKAGTWVFGTNSDQEIGDLRLIPYH